MKLVLKVEVHDHKAKSKVMQAVSGFEGIRSLTMDMKDKKLMVSGDFDPVKVVNRLRKSWLTEIVSVGPAKEDEGKNNEDTVKAYQAYHYSYPLTYSYYVPDQEETPNCVKC
ncbi:heavy metal-associated isoprenylated plant protein 39-like isoform X6 [Rhodamnia argentea]|uniref:Heavy metal-associated isoprenylated plant protein 39-like isoform X6 n=1 Tax=Rhodamnia argentea TaxID=178133 RepID=A0ABM3H5B5_9MYRT|nr:heavy metal-associated isoprenylated plant protein 39-like isoform X6 [Rhodamnia argentea]